MKRNFVFVLLLFLLVIYGNSNTLMVCVCQSPVKTEATDLVLSNVSTSSAKLSYSVCGEDVTEIGICYGTSSNPTPKSSVTIKSYEGEAIDIPIKVDYKARISGLEQDKEFYARAYLITESGQILYSSEVNFKTSKKEDYSYLFNGEQKLYYPNGTVAKKYNMKDGVVDGHAITYDDSARVMIDETIVMGETVYVISYDKKGRITGEGNLEYHKTYFYDDDGWKHTKENNEPCKCSKCEAARH